MAESPKLPASYAYQDEPEPDSHFTLPATSYPPEHPQPDEANSAGDTNGSGLVSPRVQPADEPQPQPDSFSLPATAPPPPSHTPHHPPPPSSSSSSHLPPGLSYNPALHPPKREGLPVPDHLPGDLVIQVDPEKHWTLRRHLGDLCGIGGTARFPGSQPVSFDYDSLALLEKEDFWVCEKSDGVRVLVMIVATGFGQEVYLIDRKDQIYQVYWLTFPHQDGPEYNHSNTVLDGEFVIDVDPHTGAHIPRLLLFDLLVLDSENLMSRPLLKRYGRLQQFVVEPYKKHQKTLPPDVIAQQPFEVVCKKQELSYGIEAVFRDHVPSLMHGSDGLIFTSAEAPYTPGTDPKILKWKPPSENSIDFILQLKFPAIPDVPTEPDFCAKPVFMLLMNHGHEGNHFFDTMEVDDATWEEWKASGEQYDDRVVEVVWDKTRETWKFLRFRDDKFEGNYKSVVYSIIKSIQHGVEAEQLVAHAGRIRKAWKARAAAKAPPPPPPRAQHDPSHQHHAPHPHGHSNGSHLAPPPVQGAGGYGLKR
ncbi:Dcp1p-Dcp2p decapping enzyme complex alpha subunit [Rhodotorula toruloides]|uniref:mRNA guanylyltransferase n=1 Tax=Rhodotorula toruloides TaxID=5286 RepID=A0A2T0AIY6_RHOTO|nr:mRNA capping enzyme, catalytic domain-domain containing protein [Rhodotorula toruloides]